MQETIDRQKDTSTRLFRMVEPILQEKLKGKFHPVEGSEDQTLLSLDRKAGVDWLLEDKNGKLFPVAFRGQFSKKPFYTFTIRKERDSGVKSEFDKLLEATEEDALRPHWHIQAYFSEQTGEPTAIGIAKTSDLVTLLRGGHYNEKRTGPLQIGGATFASIPWKFFLREGFNVKSWIDIFDRKRRLTNGRK